MKRGAEAARGDLCPTCSPLPTRLIVPTSLGAPGWQRLGLCPLGRCCLGWACVQVGCAVRSQCTRAGWRCLRAVPVPSCTGASCRPSGPNERCSADVEAQARSDCGPASHGRDRAGRRPPPRRRGTLLIRHTLGCLGPIRPLSTSLPHTRRSIYKLRPHTARPAGRAARRGGERQALTARQWARAPCRPGRLSGRPRCWPALCRPSGSCPPRSRPPPGRPARSGRCRRPPGPAGSTC